MHCVCVCVCVCVAVIERDYMCVSPHMYSGDEFARVREGRR